jgi:Domain of unknown function (DUF4383)
MNVTTMRTQALASSTSASSWTPARIFMVASALFHIPVGIVGFVYDRTFPIGAGASSTAGGRHVLGIFETNGWHTLGALLIGLVSLYFALRPRRAREAALAIGIGHVGLFVALVLWNPSTFWIASNGVDQIVHASTAVGGIVSGLLTPRRRPGWGVA